MNTDVELDIWREQWQAETAVPVSLRRSVERQSRWMKIGFIADSVVTLVMGGGSIARAVRSMDPDVMLVAAATWLFCTRGRCWLRVRQQKSERLRPGEPS